MQVYCYAQKNAGMRVFDLTDDNYTIYCIRAGSIRRPSIAIDDVVVVVVGRSIFIRY